MDRVEAGAIYDQGREVVVRVLVELSAQHERLTAQVQALSARVTRQEERIAELERKGKRSSRNSSQPPSADPPGSPPRRGKDPSGRKQGAQPGHEGHMFIERTRTALSQLMGRRLEDVRLAVMMLDGIEIACRTHVVALGISTDGARSRSGCGRDRPRTPRSHARCSRTSSIAASIPSRRSCS